MSIPYSNAIAEVLDKHLRIKDGGSWKYVEDVRIKDGGTWQDVK